MPAKPVSTLFHLSFAVRDLAQARRFYGEMLGCAEGREMPGRADFNFFGHQIVAYRAPHATGKADTSGVDGDQVPIRHFGLVLPMAKPSKETKRR